MRGLLPGIGWACDAFGDRSIPVEVLASRYDHRSPLAGDNGLRFEPVEVLRTASDARTEHTLTLGLSGDMVRGWVDFFREVKKRAEVGHSFSLEADREDGDKDYPRTGIDGDGSDRIVNILLDGKDVTEKPKAEDAAMVPTIDAELRQRFARAAGHEV